MENTPSTKQTNSHNRLSIVGLLLSVPPLKLVAIRYYLLHMFAQNAHVTIGGIVRWVDSQFANFGQDLIITAIIIILALGSVVVSAIGYRKANSTFKFWSIIAIIVSSAIIVLQSGLIFSAKTA